MSPTRPEIVLVHAPYGRDALMICQFLNLAAITTSICPTIHDLCAQLNDDTGAALISDESLTAANITALAAVLNAQPPWSDVPLLVTTSGGEFPHANPARLNLLAPLGNFSLLERPLRTVTLISAVQAALRARRRQYQVSEHVAERERLVRELKRSNEELTQFAHVVSHDLQAPVRLVKMFTELLAQRYQGQIDQTADEFIATIRDGTSSMETLIRTLLAYATVGQEPLARKRVAFGSVVDAVVTTLQPAIQELNAVVSCGELPIVFGDPVLMQQLMQNLIGNALKYAAQAAPSVTIAARQTSQDWVLSVSDNGPGIPAEHRETIFLPLKRLHGSSVAGTGMGLAVCRKIVARHGGRIWVESSPGNGSTFLFALPKFDPENSPFPVHLTSVAPAE